MSVVGNERVAFLHYVRKKELDHVLKFVHLSSAATASVLEFGSGDGFMAHQMAQKGYNVSAVDVAPRYPQHYPVIKIGSPELPFANESFDFIFSSNVLEHVRDLPATLNELHRVLARKGTAVFTMPTPAWRLYTLLALPLRMAFSSRLQRKPIYSVPESEKSQSSKKEPLTRSSRKPFLIRALKYAIRPHGEFPSALHELFGFSAISWRNVFQENNFKVISVEPMSIIYSGAMLFPWRGMTLRKKFCNRITTSCLAYYVAIRWKNFSFR